MKHEIPPNERDNIDDIFWFSFFSILEIDKNLTRLYERETQQPKKHIPCTRQNRRTWYCAVICGEEQTTRNTRTGTVIASKSHAYLFICFPPFFSLFSEAFLVSFFPPARVSSFDPFPLSPSTLKPHSRPHTMLICLSFFHPSFLHISSFVLPPFFFCLLF